MKFKQAQLTPLLLRFGLAFVFAYAAIGSLMHPSVWIGYLPSFLLHMQHAGSLLKLFAIYEIILALWLLSGWWVRYAALLTTASLLGIVLAQPADLMITFRDVGLMFMALALASL
ncbi:MAG TPA: DoxX family membrane protein [Candidatus Saccharimonadales bacterium]|nr:DoxX family membrane protein [Candidatus Saccharimonadales bacterium]